MKRQVILEIVLFLCVLSSAKKVSAQLVERRNSPQPSEITVTLKMKWDVIELGKSIPASHITKVPSGTVLLHILNQAAGENKKGPFNKYESVYYSGIGYHITAMNGTKQNANKYWLIVDEQTGGHAPCGVSSYVPGNSSTIIFNFASYSSYQNKTRNGYCKNISSLSQVPSPAIAVTIALEWNAINVGKPIPASHTTQVTNGTFLVDVMNKAADENAKGPFNKYASTYYGGLGHFITSINGIKQDPQTRTYWMIYDKKTGKLTPLGVDSYQPKDGSVTVFRLEKYGSHETLTERPTETLTSPTKNLSSRPSENLSSRPTETLIESSGHKFVGLGLVALCLLFATEYLLLL